MKELDKVYGIILIQEKRESYKLFCQIEKDWNQEKFHKDLYDCLNDLVLFNKELDLINITLEFKKNKVYSKEYIVRLSSLSSNLSATNFLGINQALAAIKYRKELEKAHKVSNDILHLIDSGQFNMESYINILTESIKNSHTESNSKLSNNDLIEEIIKNHDLASKGYKIGLDLGYPSLNRVVNLEEVDMMVVGARPAMGKTAFAIDLAVRLAKREKHVALFSLEMSGQQIMRRILGNIAEVDTNKIKYGKCNDQEINLIYNSKKISWLKNIHIFEGSHNVRQISQSISDLKINKKVDVFIVDYLQKVIPSRSNSSRYEQVTSISNGIKFISQNMKVPSICLAQLNRDSARSGKLPTLPDLKESGEIEQDASIVAFLHRPEYYGEEETTKGNAAENKCEFLLAKNREGILENAEFTISLEFSKFTDDAD